MEAQPNNGFLITVMLLPYYSIAVPWVFFDLGIEQNCSAEICFFIPCSAISIDDRVWFVYLIKGTLMQIWKSQNIFVFI